MAKSAAACLAILAAAFLSTVGTVQGTLRGSGAAVATGHMRVEELRAAMLDELMGALGHGSRVTESRIEAIEEALRPMFSTLHKNEHGNLDHAGVRYALHRLFVVRHAMFIKGLEPGGAGWAGASPTEVLDDRVPAFVQSLFEQRLDGRGLGLHEIAILAATLEHLVHDEAASRLKVAYEVNDVPLDGAVSTEQAEEVIDTYMVIFLLGIDTTSARHDALASQRKHIKSIYPSWPMSQKFTRAVTEEVVRAHAADPAFRHGSFTFNATSTIVEEIMERYGRWQDRECQGLKSALVRLEDKEAGKVPLKNFYGGAQAGAWQFTESVAYLKDLGALAEPSPQRQSVLIPNYINSHSNCLASSSIYSMCCLNECEALLGHIEREVGVPDANPDRLLEIVAKLPSATVEAPREISAELRGLLDEVTKQHEGKVPLHGRLFGQWMHHAYPRECPYPHKSGTTSPMTADEWISEKGDATPHHVSAEEMSMHISAGDGVCLNGTENCTGGNASAAAEPAPLMWTVEEELVVSTTSAPSAGKRWRSCLLSSVMAVAALASLAATLWSSCKDLMKTFGPKRAELLPFAGKSHMC